MRSLQRQTYGDKRAVLLHTSSVPTDDGLSWQTERDVQCERHRRVKKQNLPTSMLLGASEDLPHTQISRAGPQSLVRLCV
jgi:hypothetical protein